MRTIAIFIFCCFSFAQTPDESPTRDQVKEFVKTCHGGGNVVFDGMFAGIEKLGPKTLEHLHSLIGDPDEDKAFRLMVLRAMGELGDKGAIPYLKEYVDDVFMEDEIKNDSEFILYLLGETAKLDEILNQGIKFVQNTLSQKKEQFTQEEYNQLIGTIMQVQRLSYRMKKYDISCRSYQLLFQILPDYNQHYSFACSLALAGRLQEALYQLRISLSKKEFPNLQAMIESDGDFKNLREEPAFQELLRKLKAGETIEPPTPLKPAEPQKEEKKE